MNNIGVFGLVIAAVIFIGGRVLSKSGSGNANAQKQSNFSLFSFGDSRQSNTQRNEPGAGDPKPSSFGIILQVVGVITAIVSLYVMVQ